MSELFTSDMKKVKNRLRHMLIDGIEIELPQGNRFVYRAAGELIEEGPWTFECLEEGVFERHESHVRPYWIFCGMFTYMDRVLDRDIQAINDPMEIEGWFIGIMASQVLTQMNRERSKR